MIWRICLLLLLAWALGFAIFLLSLGKPLDARKTDAIVVLTGGGGRIDRGLAVLRAGDAKRMLVSGVDPDVRPVELAVQFKIDRKWMACCIDLGWQAVDTRSNADETAKWVREHDFRTVRLVTTDWHMPRARMELASALGGGVEVVGDAVRSGPNSPGWRVLFREYHKFLVRRIALWVGAG
ncbi:YdcF family protein [Sphingomonas sp. DG1-23]|uniref:YdcF family protein n=1 Tax=Sphingomonas sp. DG1-23 TaxID=3068316 RepID=UPI00273E841E|nr:YdcF family protein [Sphingomonas sp. DG1-23]MDP5280416.1 YdcF family protein [Sphingomonas sp. DG1-23]